MKKIWLGVKKAATTTWEAIQKLPGWAVLAMLILLATCWWFVRRTSLLKQKLAVTKKIAAAETKRDQQVETANKLHSEAEGKIKSQFNGDIKELENERVELEKEMAKGPSAIANEWKDYLEGLK